MMEKTVVLIKPDGMRKGLMGKVISRFEEAGFKMVAAKMVKLDQPLLDKWYAHHKDKDFFPNLCQFMMKTPVLAMIWQGEGVVGKVREICGATDPAKADPGTIRADFGGPTVMENIIHASDSPETAKREMSLIFSPEEIFEQGTKIFVPYDPKTATIVHVFGRLDITGNRFLLELAEESRGGGP